MNKLFVLIVLFFGGVMLVLMLTASKNLLDPDDRSAKNTAISTFWFFFPDIYNESGKKMCSIARASFFIGNAFLLAHFFC